MTFGKNMRLITTYWGQDKTFKLMPVNKDCPYMEALYDPKTNLLVVITTNMKENLQLVPKLDDLGNQIPAKKPKDNGKPWAEKYVQMHVPQEFYLIEKDEQIAFIKEFATNAEDFDFEQYMVEEQQSLMIPETQGLVDQNGMPMVSVTKKGSTKGSLSVVSTQGDS